VAQHGSIMKKVIAIVSAAVFMMAMFSSCSSQYHTTADGFRYKKAGKGYHWEYNKGLLTKKTGKPSCVDSW
jgi:hypothetical protein